MTRGPVALDRSRHDLAAQPWRRVDTTILTTARVLRAAFDAGLAGLGLNTSEAGLLAFVEEEGPMSQAELARRLGLGRPAAGEVVEGLVSAGLVRREPDPEDRRKKLVVLTAAGWELMPQVRAVDQRVRRELRSGLAPDERRVLADLLDRVRANALGLLDAA